MALPVVVGGAVDESHRQEQADNLHQEMIVKGDMDADGLLRW